MQLKNKL